MSRAPRTHAGWGAEDRRQAVLKLAASTAELDEERQLSLRTTRLLSLGDAAVNVPAAAREEKQPPARERQQDFRSAANAGARASFALAGLGAFQQMRVEDREITHRLLTIESGVSS
jgi:hypothetical protein